ncbi:MAG TPA: hypothetical protein VMR28_02605 [Candidatus Saccharimonadales bacterium]|nr:hypothetical protein [Candidatus Saccharimonadales bacterium]
MQKTTSKKTLQHTDSLQAAKKWLQSTQNKLSSTLRGLPQPYLRVGFILVPCVLYVIRAWQYISNPQLYAEDGATWLTTAYNQGLRSLFTPDNGFAHTAERIWALLVTLFPLSYAPLLFDGGGFLLFVLLCYYLFSTRLQIVTNNYQRLFMGLSLGLIANFSEFFFNFANSVFLLGIIGLCIYLAKPSNNRAVRVLEKVLFVVTCVTLPFAWFFILIALFDSLWRKQRKLFFLVVSALGSIIQLLIHHFSTYQRQTIPISTLASSRYTVIEFYNQIVTPALRFTRIDVSPTISEHHFLLMLLFCLLLLGFLFYVAVRHATPSLKYLLFFLAVFTVSAFTGPLVGGHLSPANILKYMDTAQFGNRYFFYGIFGMLLMFGLTTSLYIKRQALYWFLLLFISFSLFSSALYSSFFIQKGFVNDTPAYKKGLAELSKAKPGKTITIPENPAGWFIELKAK